MPVKLAVAVGSILLTVIAAVVVVLRKARTEHPPVSPIIPRVDAPTSTGDDVSTSLDQRASR